MQVILIDLSMILFFGLCSQWIAWRFKAPALLFYLLFGLCLGPVFNLVHTHQIPTQVLEPMVALVVAVILFEGSLNLNFNDLKQSGKVIILLLLTVGFLTTWVGIALGGHVWLGLDWKMSALLGAILAVTGPTAVLPVLKHIRLEKSLAAILRWEALAIDPLGALFAILVFQAVTSPSLDQAIWIFLLGLLKTGVLGAGLGIIAAIGLTQMMRRFWMAYPLQGAGTLMVLVVVFTAATFLQDEATGFFAVTVMGMALANQKKVAIHHILEFKENLAILLVPALFITLASRISWREMQVINGNGLWFLAWIIILVRPASVWLSTIGSSLNRKARLFLAGMAPRSVLPTDLAAPAFHACLCAGGGEVYVLLDEPEPVLAVLGDGRWRRVDLPVEFRRCRALAAATLRLGVTAVGFEPGAPGQMLFSTLRPAGWLPVERVRAEQEPVEWKATPAVAQLGDRLAVVWKDRGDWFFGTFGYDGDLVSGRAKILPERGGEALALDVQNYFFLGVLGILAALVFWPGRTLRPGPILLPPRLPPARLSRRAVAFLIDYLPISLGTFSLAGQRDWQAALEAVRRGAAPEWSVYCFVASLAVLVVYGVVMEYRFGATLGKMAMRMVVVTGEGQRPRLRQILLRNLAKVLELRTLLLLAFVLLTRYRQRLGDWVARTVVVDAYPPEPPLGQTEDKPEPRR